MTVSMNTLCARIKVHAAQQGNAPALLAPECTALSYRQLDHQLNTTIEQLRHFGVGPQDRIALVLPNGPEMAVALLAVSGAAIGAPLHPGYTTAEFEFYLADLAATAVIVAADLDSPVRAVAQARGLPIFEVNQVGARAGVFTLTTQSPPGNRSPAAAAPQPTDIALLLHTSGSTARPKLVPLSHANLWVSAQQIAATVQLTPSDRCLNVMPLFHIHSLVGALLVSLSAGSSIVCTAGFALDQFPTWLATFQPTWYTAVPTVHQAILAQATLDPAPYRCAALRFIRSSSAPLPAVVTSALEQICQVPLIEAYGMTETAGQICSNPLPPGQRKVGSVGSAAGTTVAIMATEGEQLLGPTDVGEIVVRGASVMGGYANEQTTLPPAFTQGWFRTGDQGYLDADGYLFISGRLKEVINRGGEKVAPQEVDELLLRHPAVAQAVTFGVPHPTWGEDVNTAVVLHAGRVTSARELRAFVFSQVAPYKVPTQIIIVAAMPQSAAGKLQRSAIAIQLADQLQHTYVAPAGPFAQLVAQIWAEVLGQAPIGLFDNFFALGGNSLLAMQVIARILDLLRIELRPSTLFAAPTVVELADVMVYTQLEQRPENELLDAFATIERLSVAEARQLLSAKVTAF